MTTILAVRRDGRLALGGDGQVSLGDTIFKQSAIKIRKLAGGKVLAGFAGATADAFSLLERFEGMLSEHSQNLLRAGVELAKEWRTDRALRRLESMLVVADQKQLLVISGIGDVIEPEDGIIGIGSGGAYAVAAARALVSHTDLPAREVVAESLRIAAEICLHTNDNLTIEELGR